jgi:O-antigen/teichoic acid export membrane protein
MPLRKIVFGTAIMSSVRMIRLVAQFVAIPILARLLTPEQYGVVAIAMPFALFAMMIADAGIGMSLVRTPASERVQWSTCFWLAVLFGAVLALLMAAIGPLASLVFDEPVLTPMLIALAFVVMAQATHLIPVAAMQQAKRFKTIAAVEITATFVGIGVAVYMAYHNYGAWALIGQQVAFFTVRVTGICALSPFRPLWVFAWKEVYDHIHFGRNVLGNSLLQYFARSFDSWIVGKALGSALVGMYSMAFQFARLPIMTLSAPLQYVLYADLATMKDDAPAIARTYLMITRMAAIMVFPTVGMMAAAQEPIFTFILSQKWAEAGFIFMLLAPACALQSVTSIGETVLYALGHTKKQMRCTLEYTILWIGALLIAVQYSLTEVALAFTLCTLAYQWRYQRVVLGILGISMRNYTLTILTPIVATVMVTVLYSVVNPLLSLMVWQEVLLAAAFFALGMALCVLAHRRALFEEVRRIRGHHSTATVIAVDISINS